MFSLSLPGPARKLIGWFWSPKIGVANIIDADVLSVPQFNALESSILSPRQFASGQVTGQLLRKLKAELGNSKVLTVEQRDVLTEQFNQLEVQTRALNNKDRILFNRDLVNFYKILKDFERGIASNGLSYYFTSVSSFFYFFSTGLTGASAYLISVGNDDDSQANHDDSRSALLVAASVLNLIVLFGHLWKGVRDSKHKDVSLKSDLAKDINSFVAQTCTQVPLVHQGPSLLSSPPAQTAQESPLEKLLEHMTMLKGHLVFWEGKPELAAFAAEANGLAKTLGTRLYMLSTTSNSTQGMMDTIINDTAAVRALVSKIPRDGSAQGYRNQMIEKLDRVALRIDGVARGIKESQDPARQESNAVGQISSPAQN